MHALNTDEITLVIGLLLRVVGGCVPVIVAHPATMIALNSKHRAWSA